MASGLSTDAETAQISSTAAEPIETSTENPQSLSLWSTTNHTPTRRKMIPPMANNIPARATKKKKTTTKATEKKMKMIGKAREKTTEIALWMMEIQQAINQNGERIALMKVITCQLSPDEDAYTDEDDERKTRLYRRNLHFSHGFLVEEGIRPRFMWSGGILLDSLDSESSPVKGRTQLQYAQDMAKLSLRKYNALNETYVRLDHVVRVTGSFNGTYVSFSYITFMAKKTEEDDTLVEYQAKVTKNLTRKTYPMFCRPSPKLDLDM